MIEKKVSNSDENSNTEKVQDSKYIPLVLRKSSGESISIIPSRHPLLLCDLRSDERVKSEIREITARGELRDFLDRCEENLFLSQNFCDRNSQRKRFSDFQRDFPFFIECVDDTAVCEILKDQPQILHSLKERQEEFRRLGLTEISLSALLLVYFEERASRPYDYIEDIGWCIRLIDGIDRLRDDYRGKKNSIEDIKILESEDENFRSIYKRINCISRFIEAEQSFDEDDFNLTIERIREANDEDAGREIRKALERYPSKWKEIFEAGRDKSHDAKWLERQYEFNALIARIKVLRSLYEILPERDRRVILQILEDQRRALIVDFQEKIWEIERMWPGFSRGIIDPRKIHIKWGDSDTAADWDMKEIIDFMNEGNG